MAEKNQCNARVRRILISSKSIGAVCYETCTSIFISSTVVGCQNAHTRFAVLKAFILCIDRNVGDDASSNPFASCAGLTRYPNFGAQRVIRSSWTKRRSETSLLASSRTQLPKRSGGQTSQINSGEPTSRAN